jgi:hypothetical protein
MRGIAYQQIIESLIQANIFYKIKEANEALILSKLEALRHRLVTIKDYLGNNPIIESGSDKEILQMILDQLRSSDAAIDYNGDIINFLFNDIVSTTNDQFSLQSVIDRGLNVINRIERNKDCQGYIREYLKEESIDFKQYKVKFFTIVLDAAMSGQPIYTDPNNAQNYLVEGLNEVKKEKLANILAGLHIYRSKNLTNIRSSGEKRTMKGIHHHFDGSLPGITNLFAQLGQYYRQNPIERVETGESFSKIISSRVDYHSDSSGPSI